MNSCRDDGGKNAQARGLIEEDLLARGSVLGGGAERLRRLLVYLCLDWCFILSFFLN